MKNKKILKSNNISKKIAVIGAGAWGLGIASLIAGNGYFVNVFARDVLDAAKVNKELIKKKLSAIAVSDFESCVKDADLVFIVVPSHAVASTFDRILKTKISSNAKVVICSKGLESKGLELFSQSFEKKFPKNNYAILSGPNFAGEVEEGLPTVTTIASKNKKAALEITAVLSNKNFLPIISSEVIAAQIFGATKNIFAIGCGIIDGLGLGENAKAALVLKGIIEADILIKKLGEKAEEDFVSPCGLGDLFLTCSSKKSRNNSLGVLIGGGKKVSEIIKSGKTFEGFKAADLMVKFAKKQKVDLPLCTSINKILQGNYNSKQIREIISKAILDY